MARAYELVVKVVHPARVLRTDTGQVICCQSCHDGNGARCEQPEGRKCFSARTHKVKLDRRWYTDVLRGDKPFEVRYNDRAYRRGDVLELCEVFGENARRTGRRLSAQITYVHPSLGLLPDYVVLGLRGVREIERTDQ